MRPRAVVGKHEHGQLVQVTRYFLSSLLRTRFHSSLRNCWGLHTRVGPTSSEPSSVCVHARISPAPCHPIYLHLCRQRCLGDCQHHTGGHRGVVWRRPRRPGRRDEQSGVTLANLTSRHMCNFKSTAGMKLSQSDLCMQKGISVCMFRCVDFISFVLVLEFLSFHNNNLLNGTCQAY